VRRQAIGLPVEKKFGLLFSCVFYYYISSRKEIQGNRKKSPPEAGLRACIHKREIPDAQEIFPPGKALRRGNAFVHFKEKQQSTTGKYPPRRR